MNLRIKPFNAEVKQMYENHGHFHDGDAGLDVYVINKQTIDPGGQQERTDGLWPRSTGIDRSP